MKSSFIHTSNLDVSTLPLAGINPACSLIKWIYLNKISRVSTTLPDLFSYVYDQSDW